jgi:hypothetical protein
VKIVLPLSVLVLGLLSVLFLAWGGGAMIQTFRQGPAGKNVAVALLVIPGYIIGSWALSLWRRYRAL